MISGTWKSLFGPRSPEEDAPPTDVTAGVAAGAMPRPGDVDSETAVAICGALHWHLSASAREVTPEWAAAVCVALHCRLSAVQRREPLGAASAATGWQLAGRIGIMGERLRVFQRR